MPKLTTITNYNVQWSNIRNACMTTISKDGGDKEPSSEWKKKLLVCQHSPIRRGVISWKWEEIPYAISVHFSRHHVGCEKFVSTSRADRTGIDRATRGQMDNVMMEMDANIQSIIDISRKRLCSCADSVTRKYWKDLLEAIKEYDEEIYWACVPECVRCGGCPEYKNCGFYDNLTKDTTKEEVQDIQKRYTLYNRKR